MFRLLPLVFLVLSAVSSGPVFAQSALETAEQAVAAAWAETPLGFRKVLFVTEASAFGVYTERASTVFASGEPIVVYAEPVGYGYAANPDGTFGFGFNFDLTLKTPAGEIVAGQSDFAKVDFVSRAQNREFLVQLTLTLAEAPPGDYIIEYLARDAHSEKSATISLPFTIAE